MWCAGLFSLLPPYNNEPRCSLIGLLRQGCSPRAWGSSGVQYAESSMVRWIGTLEGRQP